MTDPDPDTPLVQLCRPRWGDPTHATALPPAAAALLEQLGARARPAAVAPADVAMPADDLPAEARREIEAVVAGPHLRCDRETRLAHTRGYSTPDLIRLRAGDGGDAP